MSDFMQININMMQVKDIMQQFPINDTLLEKSFQSALIKAGRYLKNMAQTSMSQELKVSIDILRKRLQQYRINSRQIKLFFGTNPVSLSRLNPRQTNTGVDTKPVSVPHAFIARMTPQAKRSNVYKRTSKKRLPIEKQFYDIHDRSAKIIEDIAMLNAVNGWHDVFMIAFEKELIWRTRPLR